jgi:acyl-CoA thioester hydrolase
MKMVYYAKYFEYFEQGRSDLLRQIGLPYPEIERMGYLLPVIEASARYQRPARYDDLLIVRTMLREPPQARVRITYEVRAADGGQILADGVTVHTFVAAATGKPARAPERFMDLISRSFPQKAEAAR